MSGTAVIGVGNEFRGDDGVGRIAARLLANQVPDDVAVHESTGEALSLMELWSDSSRVYLIDAADAGAEPGSVQRLDASEEALPPAFFHTSTHAFSVADAIEMARSLGQLPATVIVFAVQGGSFEHGEKLTQEAERGAAEAARRILEEFTKLENPA